MKVEINLTQRQVSTFSHLFNYLVQIPTNTQEHRVIRSLLDDVALKVQKKALEVNFKPTLFSKPKKTKFTFKFHEAYYIEKYLTIVNEKIPLSDYDSNALLFIRSTFNQKIA